MHTPAQQPVERLERLKREALTMAINETLPLLAESNKLSAADLAKKILEDIQQGHNPDLEPEFRKKIKELGIPFDG